MIAYIRLYTCIYIYIYYIYIYINDISIVNVSPICGHSACTQIVDEFADDWGRSTSKECQAALGEIFIVPVDSYLIVFIYAGIPTSNMTES